MGPSRLYRYTYEQYIVSRFVGVLFGETIGSFGIIWPRSVLYGKERFISKACFMVKMQHGPSSLVSMGSQFQIMEDASLMLRQCLWWRRACTLPSQVVRPARCGGGVMCVGGRRPLRSPVKW